MIKVNRKIIIYSTLGIWLILVNIWLFNYKSSVKVTSIYDDEITTPKPKLNQDGKTINLDLRNNELVRSVLKKLNIKDERKLDGHSIIYDKLLQNHDLSTILNLDFNERCDLFFKNLYLHDTNWFLDPNEDFPLDHRHQFEFESFKKSVTNEIKEKYAEKHGIDKNNVQINDEVERMIKDAYDAFWYKTMDVEQRVIDNLSTLRIFNKCYVTNDNTFQINKNKKLIKSEKSLASKNIFNLTPDERLINTKSFNSCNEIESRVYKWLSFAYPIFERWTGDQLSSPPDMKKYIDYPEVFKTTNSKFKGTTGKPIKSEFTNNEPCFLNQFKNRMNGKGLVLSISDKHVDDTVKLIHLLRALNNHYPIQIVYYDSLSSDLKRKIVNAARNKMVDLPQSFLKVKHHFPKDYFNEKDGGLPKQEVWFVNAYNAIHINYRDKFKKFASKFLAALFNSFEEYMLIDADTVLVQNPEFFFNLKNYVSKGAYFYKDRTAAEFRPVSDGMFFQKITPSVIDKVMFDMPIITSYTTNREFFDGMGHYMESGLVLINRHLHFNSVLAMVQLNFYNPARTRVYGDKELFWLGFAANGDEDYHFNKFFVAAIGTQTPQTDRLTSDGKLKISREICSAHPGHINGEDGKSLIWFNSGYKFCGQSEKINYEDEVQKQNRLKFLKDPGEMRKYYENAIPLKHAIIPPFKTKTETLCENVIEEPKEGWKMDRDYCNSYLWCAYSSIGGLTKDGGDNTQVGQFFEFDDESVELFKYYGDVWVGNE